MSKRPPIVCTEEILVPSSESIGCSTFSACLPFGAVISSEGGCVNYSPPAHAPEDGIYSRVVVEGGCITGVVGADLAIFTPTPCAPVPPGCGETGALPDPSTTPGNLFRYDASGRPLAQVFMQPGAGVSVTGDGTASNPIIITNTQSAPTSVNIRSGNAAIAVTGTGSVPDPFTITHAAQSVAGSYQGFTFDGQGHLTAFAAPSTVGVVTGVVEGDGITVDTNVHTGIAVVSLAVPINVFTGQYQAGGLQLELLRNRIINITQNINILAGDYKIGDYVVTLNSLGSVTNVQPATVGSNDVDVSATKRFPVGAAEKSRGLVMSLARVGAFRLSYVSTTIPADIQFFVDDVNIPGDFIGAPASSTRFEAVTTARYGVGGHAVEVRSATGFNAIGYLDVVLTAVH